MVQRAKLALKDRDPQGALSALDEHDAAFPAGAYAEEAAVVRIEALVAAGDRPKAQRVADAFLRRFPESPYAQRVRGMFFGASGM
jgi:outer membrane protein assembly factor BamD (BamD/ComL family)